MWYRIKALWYLHIQVSCIPFWLATTLILTITSLIGPRKRPSPQIDPSIRRKILVTGAPLTKCLHVIRILGTAGHEIILADLTEYQHNMSKFSRFVQKFKILNAVDNGYVDSLVRIAKEEKVDWFVPISHTQTSIPDTMAAQVMRNDLNVKCLIFNDHKLTEMLDDKIMFMSECRAMGLSVPDFHPIDSVDELRKFALTGIFDDKHYFLKPLSPYSEERVNFTPIPGNSRQLDAYLEKYRPKIGVKTPYFICQYVCGKELAANAICHDGELLVFQLAPSSPMQIDYDVIASHDKISKWTRKFCRQKRLTGSVCFDFLEEPSGEIYCIECNPRLHSSITSFHQSPELEKAIRFALEPETCEEKLALPIRPKPDSKHVYWLYNELAKLVLFQTSLWKFLVCIYCGKEAVFDVEDWLPFLMLHIYQIPMALVHGMKSGNPWNIVNACLGQQR